MPSFWESLYNHLSSRNCWVFRPSHLDSLLPGWFWAPLRWSKHGDIINCKTKSFLGRYNAYSYLGLIWVCLKVSFLTLHMIGNQNLNHKHFYEACFRNDSHDLNSGMTERVWLIFMPLVWLYNCAGLRISEGKNTLVMDIPQHGHVFEFISKSTWRDKLGLAPIQGYGFLGPHRFIPSQRPLLTHMQVPPCTLPTLQQLKTELSILEHRQHFTHERNLQSKTNSM